MNIDITKLATILWNLWYDIPCGDPEENRIEECLDRVYLVLAKRTRPPLIFYNE